MNKKMYVAGIRSILSELTRKDRLVLVDEFSMKEPKTKELVAKLSAMGLESVLIVTEVFDQNLHLSARNIQNVYVSDVNGINPVNLVKYDHVLMTVNAIKKLEERYK